MSHKKENESVCAIFVSYNPTPDFYDNLKSIYNYVDKIIIVDNNSTEEIVDSIKIYKENFFKLDFIFNKINNGVATALNQGINYALENEYNFVLLMDQDSNFSEANIIALKLAAQRLLKIKHIGLLSPICMLKNGKQENSGNSKKIIIDNISTIKMNSVITSGSICRTKIFQEIGFFRDEYFIDYVDIEFCLRLRKNRFQILTLPEIFLSHTLGDPKQVIILDKILCNIVVHSPLRIYYKFRNRIWTYKDYFYLFPLWVLLDIYRMLRELVKISIFFEDKLLYYRFILKALLDGFFSKRNLSKS